MTDSVEIVPLGGLGEFGKNLLWMRCEGSSILVDVGVSFADETFPGVDRIAPDLSALSGVPIDAVLLTHGHEDHIGALPLLRETCDAPVYGFPFTLALAGRRLEEAKRPLQGLIAAAPRERRRAGEFAFTFFRVSHSVPDSAAILIEAGGRRIFHSGDFKLDPDPPDGERTDREGIAAAVGEGVDLALVDSTNAERPGHAASERVAGQGLAAVFARARHRIILTTFSSHVARISQAAESARTLSRRVALLGRSMRTVSEIAERLGRISFPSGSLVSPAELSQHPRGRLLCMASGSQGEPFSALYRLALDEHADMKLEPGDLVIFSARTIPGHERSVNRVTDHLVRRGARVVREAEPPVHVSGHAHREDIADWLRLTRPRAVVPVHGERRMLAAAAEAAAEAGIPPDRIYLLDNGDRVTLSAGGVHVAPAAVPSGRVYFDARPELVDAEIVADRRRLAEEGFVAVFLSSDGEMGEITVVARGVAAPEAELVGAVSRAARAVLARSTPEERADPEWLRAEVALAAKRACRRAFEIRPVIVPVVV
ncbi:MAG TPA: ribonuclease J [Thermoanaerobaculia bacterium]|nr:ribonuclease J [Thermoanaerobaculia bacterium]